MANCYCLDRVVPVLHFQIEHLCTCEGGPPHLCLYPLECCDFHNQQADLSQFHNQHVNDYLWEREYNGR